MPTDRNQDTNKPRPLDAAKLKRAQGVLGAATENEAVERALDCVIAEHHRRRRAGDREWSAYLESGSIASEGFMENAED